MLIMYVLFKKFKAHAAFSKGEKTEGVPKKKTTAKINCCHCFTVAHREVQKGCVVVCYKHIRFQARKKARALKQHTRKKSKYIPLKKGAQFRKSPSCRDARLGVDATRENALAGMHPLARTFMQ